MTRLSRMLYLWRTVNRLSLRDVAAESGISSATLLRIEQGRAMDLDTWRRLEDYLLAAPTKET
jgi:transcriptional regulator with XRE-family HTH domain